MRKGTDAQTARVENPQKTIINLGQADINGAHKNKPIQYDIYHQN